MCWSVPRWAVPHAPFVLGTKDTTHASEENADGYYVASSWSVLPIFGNSWRVATNAVIPGALLFINPTWRPHISLGDVFTVFAIATTATTNVAFLPRRRLSVDRVTRLHQTSRYACCMLLRTEGLRGKQATLQKIHSEINWAHVHILECTAYSS